VLLRLNRVFPGLQLTEMKKLPELKPELRQILVVAQPKIHTKSIVTRYTVGNQDAGILEGAGQDYFWGPPATLDAR